VERKKVVGGLWIVVVAKVQGTFVAVGLFLDTEESNNLKTMRKVTNHPPVILGVMILHVPNGKYHGRKMTRRVRLLLHSGAVPIAILRPYLLNEEFYGQRAKTFHQHQSEVFCEPTVQSLI
jgi:hypothetical protein